MMNRGTHYSTSTYQVSPDYKETVTAFYLEQNLGTLQEWKNYVRPVNDYK